MWPVVYGTATVAEPESSMGSFRSFLGRPRGDLSARRRLSDTGQCPLAEKVGIKLAAHGEFDDLVETSHNSVAAILKTQGGLGHLKCDAHDALGLGFELLAVQIWDDRHSASPGRMGRIRLVAGKANNE